MLYAEEMKIREKKRENQEKDEKENKIQANREQKSETIEWI